MGTKSYFGQGSILFGVMIALSAVGCAKAKQDVVSIDPAFQGYVASFLTEASEHGRNVELSSLVVQFGATKSSTERAFCIRSSEAPPTITVNEDSWKASSDAERENTIFHELGHCLLGQGHRAGTDSHGIPVSLMNPYKLDPQVYEDHRDSLLSELFAN